MSAIEWRIDEIKKLIKTNRKTLCNIVLFTSEEKLYKKLKKGPIFKRRSAFCFLYLFCFKLMFCDLRTREPLALLFLVS